MLTIDRWRKWRPSDEKFEESPGCEPPKPSEPTFEGFEGPIPEETKIISAPGDNLAAWRPDFDRWRTERCVSRSGREDSQSVASLLIDFAEWCAAHNVDAPCREPFERLLSGSGCPLKDGLAVGIVLKVDLEAALQ
jgi:hypothetical protein